MASSFAWGPHDAAGATSSTTTATTTATPILFNAPLHLSALHTPPAAQSPMTDPSEPPSPNGLSAASILASLSDSRPQTSHGLHEAIDDDDGEDDEEEEEEEEEDHDDDQHGGVALDADGDTIPMHTYSLTDVNGPPYSPLDPYSAIDDMLDQHTNALNSLNMEQDPPHTSQFQLPNGYTPSWHMSQDLFANIHDLDVVQNGNPTEEYLNHLNKDRFMSIHAFYRHLIDHPHDSYIELDPDPEESPKVIRREDLRGDECDFQGIDWSLRRTTRANIRAKRTAFENTRLSPHLRAVRRNMISTPNSENYFSFKKMDMAVKPYIPHFQLRNLMTATSHQDIFYAQQDQVMRTDGSGAPPISIMDLSKVTTDGNKLVLTTLAAANDTIIVGGFEGEYAMANLAATTATPPTLGRIKDRSRHAKSFIANHISLFDSRHTYTPQAVICSNDHRLRILDCATNVFTHSFPYPSPVNCSAISPSSRLRIVVGDSRETLITNAETGHILETLDAHSDDVFACDWADDGIHVATAAQDSTIVIWDARSFQRPLTVLHSELSIPRCVKFSPVGSGPKVLVAAEADDIVSVFNATTFESKQTIDFWGSTAGVSMTDDGRTLLVANAETSLGGILSFERCDWGKSTPSVHEERRAGRDRSYDSEMLDWCEDEDELHCDPRVVAGWYERDRRELDLTELVL